MRKIFIVGCPRSGTTLLQSMLAANPDVVSFPETHLFSKTIHINKLIRVLTVYSESHVEKVQSLLNELGIDQISELKPPVFKTLKWTELLLQVLDNIGKHFSEGEESVLLEKTPRHLHYIDLIQQADPNVFFIHLIRNGEDVVASLMEATGDSPNKWSGKRSAEKSIFWWNRSIRISRKYIGKPQHLHVRYENLIEEPNKVLRFICSNTGLVFDPKMLEDYSTTAKQVIKAGEDWKAKNTSSEISSSNKFERLSASDRQKIKKGLIKLDYSAIDINS